MSEYTEGPWIEHTTGEMPVPGDTMVKCRLKSGREDITPFAARMMKWDALMDGSLVITHYRIQADKDGWIRHVPGECPVDPKRRVLIRTRKGYERGVNVTALAGESIWGEYGDLTITEYKVVGEASEQPAQPAQSPSALEELIDAALSYKQARSSHTAALERLSDAVKAFKGE